MKVAVIGLGYVGLTTALLMDKAGYEVTGCDISQERLDSIWMHKMPFHEPGLDEYMQDHDMFVSNDIEMTIKNADVILVTVGTPSNNDGSINLQYVFDAMKEIGRHLDSQKVQLVMLKSTCVPRTSEACIILLEQYSGLNHGHHFGFVMSPEFLREGSAVEDTLHPDKVVIGFKYDFEGELAMDFYAGFLSNWGLPDILAMTNYINAEFIKYTNNAFLATKISFINEIATICEQNPGADVTTIARAIGMDKRIGPHFLNAGLGYGGSCFPKDVSALINVAENAEVEPAILKEVHATNISQRHWPIEKIRERFGEGMHDIKVAVLGMAFKPNTDDVRDSPAYDIVDILEQYDVIVNIYDPIVKHCEGLDSKFCESVDEALTGADCVIIATEWDEFKTITPETFIKLMKRPIVLDGRRIYNPMKMIKAGIEYYGIGFGRY